MLRVVTKLLGGGGGAKVERESTKDVVLGVRKRLGLRDSSDCFYCGCHRTGSFVFAHPMRQALRNRVIAWGLALRLFRVKLRI